MDMSKQTKKLIVAIGKEFNAQKVKVSKRNSAVVLSLDPETLPTKLSEVKRGVRKAMKKAKYRRDSAESFPLHRRSVPKTVFCVWRKINKNEFETVEIDLLGTLSKPQIAMSWRREQDL